MSRKPNAVALERDNLDELKARVDLAEVMRQSGLVLRKTGRNLLARCPFHEDSTASLSVKGQLWKCFGCQASGDVLSFLQLKEKLEFPAAVQRLKALAGEAGPRLAAVPAEPRAEQLAGGLSRSETLGRVADLYAQGLRGHRGAQEYLDRRGLGSRELWEAFQVGYADGSLAKSLPPGGDVRKALTQLGVLTDSGRELLQGCVVVPLTHPDAGTVGLYGRKIDNQAPVRHLYLPGPKRGVVNWQALRSSRAVWLTESVLDALSVWQAGCRDVTCLFGASGLPQDLDELLGRYAVRELRFCLDGDGPGQDATRRLFPGLAARGIACRQVTLPAGADPNQVLAEEGPAALRELLEAHQPLDSSPAPEPTPAAEPEPARPPEAPGPIYETRLETTSDGFAMHWAEVSYHVTPRPPWNGSLKVGLEAVRGNARFRDKLNLESHRDRARAIQQIQLRLGVSKTELETHFLLLLDQTERWIAEERSAQEERVAPAVATEEMTAEEREQALAFLRGDLVNQVLDDLKALGYMGEERSKLLAYLIGVSRLLEKPLAGVVVSQSGAGKSYLTEMVELLTPPESVVLYTRLTPAALYWMPRDFLKRKLVIVEERSGAEQADYSIRVLVSRHRLTMAAPMKDPKTGVMQTQTFEVEGPIAYLETTANHRLNHENATRCFELTLDESVEQTQRIHKRQRDGRGRGRLQTCASREALLRRHHHAQRLLEPVLVVIPYVDHLRFPSRWLRTRRDNERFLSLIEAVAFLHQHQRPGGTLEDGTRYIEASTRDYRLAFHLAREVLAATFHELSREGRELLELLPGILGAEGPTDMLFTRRDLRAATDWQDHRLRSALAELVEMEYVLPVSGSQGRTYHYQLVAILDPRQPVVPTRDLTTPEELERLWKD